MGTSTDGQLSFGVVFEEGYEFPWDADQYGGDLDEWWQSISGYDNPHKPFNEHGEWNPGVTRESQVYKDYSAYRKKWKEENPNPIGCDGPVELVNYCSDGCPMYLLLSKHYSAKRGHPENVDVDTLRNTDEAYQALAEFLDRFDIHTEDDPQWWLTSYWG